MILFAKELVITGAELERLKGTFKEELRRVATDFFAEFQETLSFRLATSSGSTMTD
jgi:hypothetical protein